MDKKVIFLTLNLVLILTFSLYAADQQQGEETFTITTYYPSPYGSYNELEVYRSVTYKPINKDTITNPKEGELVYDSSRDKLYLYNGQKWVAQGGGAGYFLQCGSSCPSGTTFVGLASEGTAINGAIVQKKGFISSSCSSGGDGITGTNQCWGTCNCYCATAISSGSVTVSCGGTYLCASNISAGGNPCDTLCKGGIQPISLSSGTINNVSICQ